MLAGSQLRAHECLGLSLRCTNLFHALRECLLLLSISIRIRRQKRNLLPPFLYVGAETCKTCHADMPTKGFFKSYEDSPHFATTLDTMRARNGAGAKPAMVRAKNTSRAAAIRRKFSLSRTLQPRKSVSAAWDATPTARSTAILGAPRTCRTT